MHCELFDREFHTPSLVCSRSPFLLTTSKFTFLPVFATIYLPQFVLYHQSFTLSNRNFTSSLLNLHKSSHLVCLPKVINLLRSCRRISSSLYGGAVQWSGMSTTRRGYCWEWQSGLCLFISLTICSDVYRPGWRRT